MNIKEIEGSNEDGKKILIISGVHGNELTPVYATFLMTKFPEEFNVDLFKHITIISALNKNGIIENSRSIPNQSTSDLNRSFYENTDTDYINTVKKYIDESDIIIDIHSSPNSATFMLLNQDENTNSYVDICNEFDIPYLIRYSNADTIKKYCIDKGKIAFTLETNRMNYIDKISANYVFTIIEKLISHSQTLEIKQSEPKHESFYEFITHKTGMFVSDVDAGEIVSKGDLMGTVINLDSFNEYDVRFNRDGKYRVICFGGYDYVDANNSICYLQKIN